MKLSALVIAGGLILTVLVACKKSEPPTDAPLRVAAAADLAFAFKELGAEFEKRTGRKVEFIFGSTGLLAKQLAEGAPFDVFAAANVDFVDEVVKAGACDPETKALYGRGRIVVWSKTGGVAPSATLSDLADARFVKIAIANPEHAPYGKAAKQAMEKAGVWPTVEKKIVYGENVQQTLQFAQTGNAEAAITALSLATMTEGGQHFVIDEGLHEPVNQALVVCKHGAQQAAARDFVALVASNDGRALMKRFGFLLPGEAPVQK